MTLPPHLDREERALVEQVNRRLMEARRPSTEAEFGAVRSETERVATEMIEEQRKETWFEEQIEPDEPLFSTVTEDTFGPAQGSLLEFSEMERRTLYGPE